MIAVARVLLDVLFASLWQDALIAICIAAILFFWGRNLNAATRHVILQSALVAIVLVPLVTTLVNVKPHEIEVVGHGVTGYSPTSVVPADNSPTPGHRIDVVLSDRAVLMFIGAWVIGVFVLSLRVGLGSLQLQRLVRRSKRLADYHGVRLYASTDVVVPLAFGFATPSMMVPTALAADPGEDGECVLLHELAHVRRHDAWANACERILHALFFFNPAVSLMLRAIALEREAACDDWAVAHSQDIDTYTRSLAAFAVRGVNHNGKTAAFGAMVFGHAVLNRIERLENVHRNGSVSLSHSTVGGFAFMLATIALTLQLLAPAIAFAPQTQSTPSRVASEHCTQDVRFVAGPKPPGSLQSGRMALVDVQVSPLGTVLGAKVAKSSGNAGFDRAVIMLAKKNIYAPAVRNCKPVDGTFRFMLET